MGGTLALRMGFFVAAIVGFGRTRRTRLRFLNRYGWPRECRTASLIGGDRIESEGYREGGGEDRTGQDSEWQRFKVTGQVEAERP